MSSLDRLRLAKGIGVSLVILGLVSASAGWYLGKLQGALSDRRPNQPADSSSVFETPSRSPSPAPISSNATSLGRSVSPPSPLTSSPLTSSLPNPRHSLDIYPEVWTKNGYDGASYEYKVNCGSNYATLETCFLWDVTRVVVTAPTSQTYELSKDFNINSYSGEITRRWVLYGPAGGGLPVAGSYTFTYFQNETVALTETLSYTPEVVDPPQGVTYQRTGNDLTITWTAPAGITSQMWYKPIVDPPGSDRQIISLTSTWDQTSALLKDIPVSAGEEIEINVAVFFPGGYAYPQPLKLTW